MKKILLVISLLIGITTVSYANVQNGLVGWWKFDEGSGATTADSSGQGKTGTLAGGPTWVRGKRGNALTFAGGSGVTFSSIATSDTFTISAWVNPTGTNSSYNTIIIQDSTNGLWFQPGSGFTWEIGGTDHFSSSSVNNNEWSHVALVSSSGNTTWYINGVAQGVHAGCTGFSLLKIGDDGVGSDAFDGSIDDVRIYNRTLSAEEISYLYANGVQIKNAVIRNAKINN